MSLPTVVLGNFTAEQLASMGRTQINVLSPAQSATVIPRVSAAQIALFNPYQLMGINLVQLPEAQQSAVKAAQSAATPPYCPALVDAAAYGPMPLPPVISALGNYRNAWEGAAGRNCFDANSYKLAAACPASARVALVSAANALLDSRSALPPGSTAPFPAFVTMGVPACR